jgi:hypothetical protein
MVAKIRSHVRLLASPSIWLTSSRGRPASSWRRQNVLRSVRGLSTSVAPIVLSISETIRPRLMSVIGWPFGRRVKNKKAEVHRLTIFLHRHQAHRVLDLHPIASHLLRFWLWLATGMVTREWVAIHRKHHANCETPEDPHSPLPGRNPTSASFRRPPTNPLRRVSCLRFRIDRSGRASAFRCTSVVAALFGQPIFFAKSAADGW